MEPEESFTTEFSSSLGGCCATIGTYETISTNKASPILIIKISFLKCKNLKLKRGRVITVLFAGE